MSVYKIKQIPDEYAQSTGLSKYNRSRMPKCKDGFYAGQPNGRYITGIDELQSGISKETAEKRKKQREFLEKITGKDLSAISSFWETFKVELPSDEEVTMSTDDPMQSIALRMLLANGYVAPSVDVTGNPEYINTQYYIYTEEGAHEEEVTVHKKRDKAISLLSEISEDKDKMLLYGQYLEGPIYHDKLKEVTLYKMLRSYIDNKDIKNALKFTEVLKMSSVELQLKVIVDKAIRQDIIAKNSIGKGKSAYQFGAATLGTDIEDVYKALSLPEFAVELKAIKKELDN